MTFAHPARLWLLLLLLPMAGLALRSGWKWRQSLAAIGHGRATTRSDGFVLRLMICAFVVIALAQPRWGNNATLALPPGRDLILVIDASRSMAAEDAVPNRMAIAVESSCSIIDALATEPGDRVAVIGFAGAPVLRCGLTGNLGSAREVVRSISPGSVNPGGTDLAAAIDLALDSFDDRDHAQGRAVVVLTDGEDLSGGVVTSIPRWAASGIVIHAVTIGDADDGHAIPTGKGLTPLMYQGEPVRTKRQDSALEAVAKATGGKFIPLGISKTNLRRIYRESMAPAEASWRTSIGVRDQALIERFPWFLGAALAAWLAVQFRPWFRGRTRPLASLFLVMLSFGFTSADTTDDLVARGVAHYNQGEFAEARVAFQRAQMRAPDDPLISFNLAATYFQQGQYFYAQVEYYKVLKRAEPAKFPKIAFALGNCKVMLRDPAEAIRWYDLALQGLRKAPLLPPQVKADIQANRAFALKQLQAESPPERGGEKGADPNEEQAKQPEGPSAQPPEPEPTAPPGSSGASSDQGPSRGMGGAGGQETAGTGQKSAIEQLADAVDSIRRSKETRSGQDSPPLGADRPEKDW